MTVSQLVFDNKRFDATLNYSEYMLAVKKGDKDVKLGYNIEDKGFKALMRAVSLSTTASFLYKNLEEKIIKEQMKKKAMDITSASKLAAFREEYEASLLTAPDT
jgi:magnesium-transporting ATPase (P-type)